MSRSSLHQISIRISCRHKGRDCRPGYELITHLRAAIDRASGIAGDDFEISGIACMAGCDRPCTVAYYGSGKVTYLFGDIDPDDHIDDLIAFARQYASPGDGWSSASQRPEGLENKTLARVPASILQTTVDGGPVQ